MAKRIVMFGVPLRERLLARIDKDAATGCWIFTGGGFDDGYGAIGSGGEYGLPNRSVPAHRAAWCAFVGPIPDGNELHHTCEVLRCVNPSHLLPTDKPTHYADLSPNNPTYTNKRKTECDHGHPLSGANLRIEILRTGRRKRVCRECALERKRRSVAKHGRTPYRLLPEDQKERKRKRHREYLRERKTAGVH